MLYAQFICIYALRVGSIFVVFPPQFPLKEASQTKDCGKGAIEFLVCPVLSTVTSPILRWLLEGMWGSTPHLPRNSEKKLVQSRI